MTAVVADDQLVADAIAARRRAEATELGASPSRWQEADNYAELSERGWSQRRIARECGTSQTAVSFFVRASIRYLIKDERPTFWHAYAEVTGEKKTQPPRTDAELRPVAGAFSTLVVDPPWQYSNRATRGAAEDHYSTMSQDELLLLPETCPPLAESENSHLYLWATTGMLREAFDLVEAWGYEYKTNLVWVKPQMGMGNYFRVSHEHVLFGVRGNAGRTRVKDAMSWFSADRRKHSAKPPSFYDMVERASPPPYIDLFSRERRINWEGWGLEA